MSQSMEIVEVKGLYALNTNVILKHHCVTPKEKGAFDIEVDLIWGLSSNLEKELKNNPNYFDRENLFVLFSEDERVYRGFKLLKASHKEIKFGFQLDLTVMAVSEHQQGIIDYLVRKREYQALEESMEKRMDKITEKIEDQVKR